MASSLEKLRYNLISSDERLRMGYTNPVMRDLLQKRSLFSILTRGTKVEKSLLFEIAPWLIHPPYTTTPDDIMALSKLSDKKTIPDIIRDNIDEEVSLLLSVLPWYGVSRETYRSSRPKTGKRSLCSRNCRTSRSYENLFCGL